MKTIGEISSARISERGNFFIELESVKNAVDDVTGLLIQEGLPLNHGDVKEICSDRMQLALDYLFDLFDIEHSFHHSRPNINRRSTHFLFGCRDSSKPDSPLSEYDRLLSTPRTQDERTTRSMAFEILLCTLCEQNHCKKLLGENPKHGWKKVNDRIEGTAKNILHGHVIDYLRGCIIKLLPRDPRLVAVDDLVNAAWASFLSTYCSLRSTHRFAGNAALRPFIFGIARKRYSDAIAKSRVTFVDPDKPIFQNVVDPSSNISAARKLLKEALEEEESIPAGGAAQAFETDEKAILNQFIHDVMSTQKIDRGAGTKIRLALHLYFFSLNKQENRPFTQKEVAEQLGVTPERVSQMIGKNTPLHIALKKQMLAML